MTNIGLLDYDTVYMKYYYVPNYDIGLTYAYLSKDKNNSVHLITSLSLTNLSKYDKIYIFKVSKDLPHPVSIIREYYKLPIEEYGPGFIDKPLRPFLLETRDMLPDCSCYNSMILFSLNRPDHRLAWKIDKRARGGKYRPIRLYEMFEGEDLKKDYPTSTYNIVYDNPHTLLNDPDKWQYYNKLLDERHHFIFSQRLDISQIHDTNKLEQVFKMRKYASLRYRLEASEINDKVEWLVNYKLNGAHSGTPCILSVKLPPNYNGYQCFKLILLFIYYSHKTKFEVRFRIHGDVRCLQDFEPALLAYRYLMAKPTRMSYYEYVTNISYLRIGVSKTLLHTGEQSYEYLFKHYGMTPTLQYLEKWLRSNPQYEEHIFIGGDSDYGKQRTTYYDQGRSGFNIKSSFENISD